MLFLSIYWWTVYYCHFFNHEEISCILLPTIGTKSAYCQNNRTKHNYKTLLNKRYYKMVYHMTSRLGLK